MGESRPDPTMAVNFYEVLGVPRSATDAEVKARFRELARHSHPDRVQGKEKAEAEKQFQLLTEAMNVLTNPTRRKAHDFELDRKGGGREGTSDPAAVAKAYLAKGIKSFKAGDFEGAFENFDMAVKHTPQDSKAHQYLAMACSKSPRRIRQGISAIEKAIELEPMNETFLREAARMYRQVGLASKAERAWESVLKWSPDDEEALTALAELRGTKKGDAGKGLLGGLFRKNEA